MINCADQNHAKRILGIDYIHNIMAKVKDVSLSKQTVEELGEIFVPIMT